MLFRIRNPNIRKLALVKNPASGHRWHLLKSAPAPDEDAALERWADSLTRNEAEAVVREIEIHQRVDSIEAKLAKAEPAIKARRALGVLAKSAATPEQQLAAVAREMERSEIVDRQRRILADMRSRPTHATSWMYNEPTASAERVADYVMRLKRAGGS
jgi:hypothetical protein